MVAGPVTGAEGGEQAGRDLPDLRVWSEFAIPAQRADETASPDAPGGAADQGAAPVLPGGPPLPPIGRMPRQMIGPAESGSYFNSAAPQAPVPPGNPEHGGYAGPGASRNSASLDGPESGGYASPRAPQSSASLDGPEHGGYAGPGAPRNSASLDGPEHSGYTSPGAPRNSAYLGNPEHGGYAGPGVPWNSASLSNPEHSGDAGPGVPWNSASLDGPERGGYASPGVPQTPANAGNPESAPSTSAPFTAAVPPIGAAPLALPAAPHAASFPEQPRSAASAPTFVPGQSGPGVPVHTFIPGQPATEVTAEFASLPIAPAAPATPAEAAPEHEQPQTQPERQPRKRRSDRHSNRSRMRRQTSAGIVVLSCFAASFLVLHRFLPDVGGVGSLLETWLPWVGVPVLVLLIAAAVVHTRTALIVTFAAALVWTALYGPTMLPRGSSAAAQLRIFSEDVNGEAREATAAGTMAIAQHAGIVALEDMYSSVSESNAVNALNAAYPNHVTQYEFGLWSAYPILNVQPIALGTTQSAQSLSVGSDSAGLAASASAVPVIGALKATLSTPDGPLTVYLVHLPQPVLGDQGFAKSRDQALTQFAKVLKADNSARLAVIGDINVAATDRQFSQLARSDSLTSAQQAVGSGFGFTWPAEFPIVRLDDVLTRGLQPLRSVVLPSIAKGQTHLPIQVDLDY